jgi:hypothetical protein
VLSPNDVRLEEGWPRVERSDADSIEPPAAGGKPASEPDEEQPPKPAPADDDETGGRIAHLGSHRQRATTNAAG